MERRFELRKEALLKECKVSPSVFRGMDRLERFVEPFASCLMRKEQRWHIQTIVSGLISDLDRKNIEPIAYRHNQDRKDLQHFDGESNWDHEPLMTELARQVGDQVGRDDAVLVFDPSGFPKERTESVGTQRQWCGRLDKVDNCQVGVYMGYVSAEEHALVAVQLYLPKSWATDRRRRKKSRVPKSMRYKTRHQLASDMLDQKGPLLVYAWVAGDDEMERSSTFRRKLRDRK